MKRNVSNDLHVYSYCKSFRCLKPCHKIIGIFPPQQLTTQIFWCEQSSLAEYKVLKRSLFCWIFNCCHVFYAVFNFELRFFLNTAHRFPLWINVFYGIPYIQYMQHRQFYFSKWALSTDIFTADSVQPLSKSLTFK